MQPPSYPAFPVYPVTAPAVGPIRQVTDQATGVKVTLSGADFRARIEVSNASPDNGAPPHLFVPPETSWSAVATVIPGDPPTDLMAPCHYIRVVLEAGSLTGGNIAESRTHGNTYGTPQDVRQEARALVDESSRPILTLATASDTARRNAAVADLSQRPQADGPQFVDGSRWVWQATGAANGATVVNAQGGGVWVREIVGPVLSRWFVRGDSGVDVRVPLQAFLDYLSATRQAGVLNRGVYLVSSDPTSIDASICVQFRDNTTLTIEPGAVIKAVPGQKGWARVVTIQRVSNVRIFGTLEIDGSVSTIAESFEHSHGLHIWAADFQIDAVRAYNCRGDNVHIGGDEPGDSGGRPVRAARGTIGSVLCTSAGRKNIALHNCAVDIRRLELDNIQGGGRLYGGEGDDTDGHCLDIEPDHFQPGQGAAVTLGTVILRGSGADFSSKSGIIGREYRAEIGTLDMTITPRTAGKGPVLPWIQYGCTVNVGTLTVRGADQPLNVRYPGAALIVNQMTVDSTCPTFAVTAQATSNEEAVGRPLLDVQRLTINNTAGGGLQADGAEVRVGKLSASTKGPAFNVRETINTGNQNVSLNEVETYNTGSSYVGAVSTVTAGYPRLTIGKLTATDDRASKPPRVLYISPMPGGAGDGVQIGSINGGTIAPVTFEGATGYYTQSQHLHVCKGAPTHAAAPGTLATRIDGGAGSTMYAREGDVWVAK